MQTIFPVAGAAMRRTGDSDVGIQPEVAVVRDVHHALEALGYEATAGNSYERRTASNEVLSIDVLIPSATARYEPDVMVGESAFDGVPGCVWL